MLTAEPLLTGIVVMLTARLGSGGMAAEPEAG